MLKLNAWIKRFSIPLLWGAGILIALAVAFSHIFGIKIVADVCFIAAFVLSGMPILLRAIQALRFKTVSIELLVSIAAIGACVIGEFNESAIVTFLFQFGSFLEQKTMKKTRSAIRALTEMAPTTAWRIIENGAEDVFETEEIDADEVEIGDILLVKAGGKIASDGIVVKGDGYAAEASITGEPIAKHKTVGDTVYAGTILDSGTIQMRATKVGEDTTFAKIIALVEEAQETLRVRKLRPDLLPIVLPVAPELLRRPDSCVLEASVLAFVVVLLRIRRNGELHGREKRRYQVALVR